MHGRVGLVAGFPQNVLYLGEPYLVGGVDRRGRLAGGGGLGLCRELGRQNTEQVQLALDMAKAGGMKDLAPGTEVISTQFKLVSTKP